MKQQIDIGIQADIPEELFVELKKHIDSKESMNWERLITGALSLYLLQNGANSKEVNRIYLESLFGCQI